MNSSNTKTQRTQVQTRTTTLSPMEEKVVRMTQGLRAPDSLELEWMGNDNPELAAQLAEIEEKAFAAVGARENPAKDKIVRQLRRKS